MTQAISVLKPGLLVSLKTSLSGGVQYTRTDIEREHETAAGSKLARWETRKEITDPAEFDQATKIRGEARAMVAKVCCSSAFGLLCPSDKEIELREAVDAARDLARRFNGGAQLSQVGVYVLIGRIAQDDLEAARAINSELRGLVDAMKAGIRAADPEAIREAANKARALAGMLTEETSLKIQAAIREARTVARQLVKAGESAAEVLGELKLEALDAARFAFLDLDPGTVETVEPVGRGIDLPPETVAARTVYALPSLSLEL